MSPTWLATCLRAWETIQVELQGQYSLSRFHALLDFQTSTSTFRATAITVATPISSILVVLLLEILPLNPASEGVYHQTLGYWLRAFITGALISFATIYQFHLCAPSLPLISRQVGFISTGLGLYVVACTFGLGVTIGFPVPFLLVVIMVPWGAALVPMLWKMWAATLRQDPEVKANALGVLEVDVWQTVLVLVYMAHDVIFSRLHGLAQTAFAICLPLFKLVFKNLISRGLFTLEDLAPTYVVFNSDVFQAAFVASTMQTATSNGSVGVIMLVDILQFAVAHFEILQVLQRARQWMRPPANGADVSPALGNRPETSLLLIARQIVQSSAHVGNHPSIALPRHRRIISHPKSFLHSASVVPVSTPRLREISVTDREVQVVKLMLRLLHMLEFYVLIEFVETIMAVIYYIYLAAMTVLPSRYSYKQLRGLSDAELAVTVQRVGVYASLELVSFVLMCTSFDRIVHGYSSLHQVAYVLHKHWKLIQASLLFWICYVIACSLEHSGMDYSFRFEWLRRSH